MRQEGKVRSASAAFSAQDTGESAAAGPVVDTAAVAATFAAVLVSEQDCMLTYQVILI